MKLAGSVRHLGRRLSSIHLPSYIRYSEMNIHWRFRAIFGASCQSLLFLILLSVTWNCALTQTDNATNLNTTAVDPNAPAADVVAATSAAPQGDQALCAAALDCASCIAVPGKKCYFCGRNDTLDHGCVPYPLKNAFPTSAQCPLASAYWGVCFVSFLYLIIGGTILGAILLLIIFTICLHCCRKKKPNRNTLLAAQEAKYDQEANERHQRFEDRKAARDQQMGQIRAKYGLNNANAGHPAHH